MPRLQTACRAGGHDEHVDLQHTTVPCLSGRHMVHHTHPPCPPPALQMLGELAVSTKKLMIALAECNFYGGLSPAPVVLPLRCGVTGRH